MAALPSNVDRIGDGGGYRYVAYAADGFVCRLRNTGRSWEARAGLTGAYVGKARTLTDIAAKVAAYTVKVDTRHGVA